MAETYCGKTCDLCEYRESTNCPGCKTGPGRRYGGDCEIAGCTQERGHQDCATCTHQSNCAKLQRSKTMPLYRQRRQQEQERSLKQTEDRAVFSAKWLWVLFWLVIPSSIASVLDMDTIAQRAPGLYWFGVLLNVAVSVAYGSILLHLRRQAEGYSIAGICRLVTAGISLPVLLLGGTSAQPWTLLLTIPGAVVGLVAERNEYLGHSNILVNVDDDLSEKWDRLWKQYLGCMAGVIGGTLLVFLLPVLGALAVLACSIWLVIISILKLYYLYCTAREVERYPNL